VTEYAYTGLGDRIRQIVNGVTTDYVLDINTGLTQVLQDGTNTYLYGINRVAQSTAEQSEFFLPDALGSVRNLVNSVSEVTLIQSYTPFGEVLESYGDGQTDYAFTGEMYDAGTGLVFLRARYYNPAGGRFLSRDVWDGDNQMPMSYNAWLYTYANPVGLVDPSGNIPTMADVKNGDVVYSCNCGFIDFGHVNSFLVQELLQLMDKEEEELNEFYFRFSIGTDVKFVSKKHSSITPVVRKGLADDTKKEVALGIYRTLNENIENHQLWFTSYSFEDLSSDEIGFYLALRFGGVDPRQNEEAWNWLADRCKFDKDKQIAIDNSVNAYKSLGGFLNIFVNLPKIKEWGNAFYCDNIENCSEDHNWPNESSSITPILPNRNHEWWEYDKYYDEK
jgi:RHS repeat-associated protein